MMLVKQSRFALGGSRGQAAFSLPEVLVTAAIGGMVLAAVMSLALYSARAFVGIGNYIDLDQVSQHALDMLSRDIRQAAGLKRYSPTSLTFTNMDNSEVVIM